MANASEIALFTRKVVSNEHELNTAKIQGMGDTIDSKLLGIS